MLITRWNEASRALPVLALKSNYLDCWPNDCVCGNDVETTSRQAQFLLNQCRTSMWRWGAPRELELINSALTDLLDGCVTVRYSLTSQTH